MKKYNIIYSDPPWHYRNYAGKAGTRWVGNQYATMSLADICALPVGELAAKDCALFLWTTPPCLPEAMKVVRAWGFTYKTKAFTWIKTNKKADTLFWGMGYWTRSNSEDCWLALKGKPKRINAGVHQVVRGSIGQHSAKPDEVRNRIVKLMGELPRIELFARKKVIGWDAWGDEIEGDIEVLI